MSPGTPIGRLACAAGPKLSNRSNTGLMKKKKSVYKRAHLAYKRPNHGARPEAFGGPRPVGEALLSVRFWVFVMMSVCTLFFQNQNR